MVPSTKAEDIGRQMNREGITTKKIKTNIVILSLSLIKDLPLKSRSKLGQAFLTGNFNLLPNMFINAKTRIEVNIKIKLTKTRGPSRPKSLGEGLCPESPSGNLINLIVTEEFSDHNPHSYWKGEYKVD